jgi:hypothetical protein
MILLVLSAIAIAWLTAVVLVVAMCIAAARSDRRGVEPASGARHLRLVA